MNSNQEVPTELSIYQLLENFKEFKDGRGHIASVSRFGRTLDNSINWLNKLEEMFEYKKIYGHCNVKKNENYPLCQWVNKQRIFYKKQKMSEERINILNAIGFSWAAVSDRAIWFANFEALKEYKAKYGDDNVPPGHQLWIWVQQNRKMYRPMLRGFSTELTKERFELLKSIGFDHFVHNSSHATECKNSYNTKIDTAQINKVSPAQEDSIMVIRLVGEQVSDTTSKRNLVHSRGTHACKDNYKLVVPTRIETNHEERESTIRNEVRPTQEDIEIKQSYEQLIVEESKTETGEKSAKRIENEANLKEAQVEAIINREVEKTYKRNVRDKVQVLCNLSILFQEQKRAVYSSIGKRKLDNSARLKESKCHKT